MSSADTLVLNQDMMPVSILPLSQMIWQDAIKAVWLDNVAVIDYYDDWVVHSPRAEFRVPAVVITREYIPMGRGIAFSAENVFLRDGYKCQYCQKKFKELTMDHVHPQAYGGKTSWDNIVAACSPCNNSRGANVKIQPVIKPWVPTYWQMVERRRQFPITVPHESWATYLQWGDGVIVKNKRDKPKVAQLQLVA